LATAGAPVYRIAGSGLSAGLPPPVYREVLPMRTVFKRAGVFLLLLVVLAGCTTTRHTDPDHPDMLQDGEVELNLNN
jgi:hypothetical protein